MAKSDGYSYRRYRIETKATPDVVQLPPRFRVRVKRGQLALLLLRELWHYRANRSVILSRPCVYGVFSGPLGGFRPRERLCVGCLRCTTEYPEIVQIHDHPDRLRLGDGFVTPEQIETIMYEAQTGRVPVKGAGYRGRFGGSGWDSMWTDMSEIVRPTRDGIHGREFISTAVDLGYKRPFLSREGSSDPDQGTLPRLVSIPIPLLFDYLPALKPDGPWTRSIVAAAHQLQTFAILSLPTVLDHSLNGSHVVPLVHPADGERLSELVQPPRIIELDGWDEDVYAMIRSRFPSTLVALRLPAAPAPLGDLLRFKGLGVEILHLVADYHGRGADGYEQQWALDIIRKAHGQLVKAGCRDEVTLLVSGGIVAAEHVPKAIICGADAVGLDLPVLLALQARTAGSWQRPKPGEVSLAPIEPDWGVQRLKNLVGSWRDQLLEVLGAMGLREVRRLRGEVGRAIFQHEAEREAFAGIAGYD